MRHVIQVLHWFVTCNMWHKFCIGLLEVCFSFPGSAVMATNHMLQQLDCHNHIAANSNKKSCSTQHNSGTRQARKYLNTSKYSAGTQHSGTSFFLGKLSKIKQGERGEDMNKFLLSTVGPIGITYI